MAYVDKKDIYKLFEETNGIIRLHVSDVDMLPTADVVGVRHGEWTGGEFNNYSGEYEEQCSNCKKFSREYTRPYCPNCGAKMDGGSET